MERLTASRRVLRFDARGHGDSGATPSPYTLQMLVDDVVGLMDALEIDQADVLGLSLGGMTGLGLAIHHPDRLRSLACCAAIAQAPPEYAQLWRDRIELVQREGVGPTVDGTLERWFTPAFRAEAENAATLARVRAMILGTSVAGYCGCAAALTGLDYGDRLAEIAAPVLYLAGAEDQGAPASVMAEMARATPGSRFEIIEPAAHLVNLERPEAFGELVASWLTKG
jgi:3-oxoadipate enol-lactonase